MSLAFAIPDHAWVDTAEAAAVRVAMSAIQPGLSPGFGIRMVADGSLEEGEERERFSTSRGILNSFFRTGVALNAAKLLKSNEALSHQGVTPGNKGFRLDLSDLVKVGRNPDIVREYIIGSDLTDRRVARYIIDFYGISKSHASSAYPELFQHIVDYVKPERDQNRRPSYREKYWMFVEPRSQMRNALVSIPRMIVTCRTARQRVFIFENTSTVCDAKVIVIAHRSAALLACLSSKVHLKWADEWARLGKGNDHNYNHSECFNLFPFPLFADLSADLASRLESLGERLDAFRKQRLAEHDFLTMTGLYNVLERLRELEDGAEVPPLDSKEREIHDAGLVSVLKEIHDDIDRTVFEAYGWIDMIPKLLGKPGATTSSQHKSAEQEAAEEELLVRLVALNVERAAYEALGGVHWLRPEYQAPKFGGVVAHADGEQIEANLALAGIADVPKWPNDAFDQIRIVRDLLVKVHAPALPETLAAAFDGRVTDKRKKRVVQVLETLVATGAARISQVEGTPRYFVPQ